MIAALSDQYIIGAGRRHEKREETDADGNRQQDGGAGA
jgi:hypothetical protein